MMTEKENEPRMEEILASIQSLMSVANARSISDRNADARPVSADQAVRSRPDKTARGDFGSGEPSNRRPALQTPGMDPDTALVSSVEATKAIGSFLLLDRELGEKRAAQPGDLLIEHGAARLEETARELMRPMLKEWLDLNLPVMVERLVREEIRRLASLAKDRDSR